METWVEGLVVCRRRGVGGMGSTWDAHAQIVLELDREWSEEEVLRALETQPAGPEWTVVKGLDAPWSGVEVLDQRMEWAACSAELEARLHQANPSKHAEAMALVGPILSWAIQSCG